MLHLSEKRVQLSIRAACLLMAALTIARGASFLLSKHLLGAMEPLNLLGLRFLMAFAILVLLFPRRVPEEIKNDPKIIGSSCFRIFRQTASGPPENRGLLVNDQLQHIRSRVMTDSIVLHLAGCGKLHVEIRIDDRFFIPYGLRHVVPVRIYDAAAAAAYHFRQIGKIVFRVEIIRIRRSANDHIAVYEIAFALNGDMLYRRLPFRVVICIRRNIS